jgi:hypothetical protein
MKNLLFIVLLFSLPVFGQDNILVKASRDLHQKLISNDPKLSSILDENLSYGHSNGWVESKENVIQDLASGKLKYVEIKEDSITSIAEKDLGYIRFVAEMAVEMDGKPMTLRLKVLEVWRKKNGSWKLFARQATKA